MNKEMLLSQQEWIREELMRCADFWVKNGWDHENGGCYMHGGGDLGYSSIVYIDPVKKIAFAGAMNMPASDENGSFYGELMAML